MFNRLDAYELRNLCVENHYYTCGDNDEYEELFELNSNESIETYEDYLYIITMNIWYHTYSGVTISQIHDAIDNEIKRIYNKL